jgi:hypothetical protein
MALRRTQGLAQESKFHRLPANTCQPSFTRADFSGQHSGFTRLDRVNACFQDIKIVLKLRQNEPA